MDKPVTRRRGAANRASLCAAFGLYAALYVLSATAAPPVMPYLAEHTTLGTVSCAASTCHGSVTPWAGSDVLQNEYTTWSRLDRHTQAYQVLLNETSRRIMRNLGISTPAETSKICLDCHSHNPSAARRGERFVHSEGIGCEACHGPAERWIGPHTEETATTRENVAAGMYPTSDPVQQARLCLSCHFGDANRFVNHRIMGAGHPRMSFEVSTFGSLQPAHFRVDEDYIARKGDYDSVRLWALGQVLAAQALLDTLADPKRGRVGLFPELVVFDCHACHHPMSDKRWTPATGPGPGSVRMNDSHLLMLRAVIAAVYPSEAEGFERQIAATHEAIVSGRTSGDRTPMAMVKDLSRTLGSYLPRLRGVHFSTALQRVILLKLIDATGHATDDARYADYAGAEQAYMAIVTLANDLIGNGALSENIALGQTLASLLATLADDEHYEAATFRRYLSELRTLIAAQARS